MKIRIFLWTIVAATAMRVSTPVSAIAQVVAAGPDMVKYYDYVLDSASRFDPAKILEALKNPYPNHVAIMAHRGFWGREYPENSIPSVIAAEQAGIEMVELDIRISSDHVPMVFHDSLMYRTTGVTGVIDDFTAAQLKLKPLIDPHKGTGGEANITMRRPVRPICSNMYYAISDNDPFVG